MPLGLVPALVQLSKPVPASDCGGEWAPPKGFRVAEGVQSAWLLGEGPFGCTPRRANRGTAAQRAGKRYERQALAHLVSVFGRRLAPHQWFKWWDGTKVRFCEVDALFHADDGVVIFEIKVNFCVEAWWQLRKLYEPVVRKALSPERVGLVVVCRSYDPAVAFPEPCGRIDELASWHLLDKLGVFQWRNPTPR